MAAATAVSESSRSPIGKIQFFEFSKEKCIGPICPDTDGVRGDPK